MYFILVTDIATGKIVDKVEFSAGLAITGETAKLAQASRKFLQQKYPDERYRVSFREADNFEDLQRKLKDENEESNKQIQHTGGEILFSMSGSRYYLLLINISAIIFGSLIIFILLAIRLLFNPFLFIVCIMLIGIYCYADYKIWMKRGIQKVVIDTDGITIYRGARLKPFRIEKSLITGINIFKKINRHVINILLGGTADKVIPGVTIFSGKRIRLTDDAFGKIEFNVFIEKLRELKPNLFY